MPAYNEATSVTSVIRKVLEQPQVAERIVVDDTSTDGTCDVFQQEAQRLNSSAAVPQASGLKSQPSPHSPSC